MSFLTIWKLNKILNLLTFEFVKIGLPLSNSTQQITTVTSFNKKLEEKSPNNKKKRPSKLLDFPKHDY